MLLGAELGMLVGRLFDCSISRERYLITKKQAVPMQRVGAEYVQACHYQLPVSWVQLSWEAMKSPCSVRHRGSPIFRWPPRSGRGSRSCLGQRTHESATYSVNRRCCLIPKVMHHMYT